VLEKAERLQVEIDGGINDETIEVAYASGARRFVATSFLFGMENPESQYRLLQERIAKIAVS